MTGRKNHPRTDDENMAEHRMHERVERGEKITGELAGWLDRAGPAGLAGQRRDAESRHSHVRRR